MLKRQPNDVKNQLDLFSHLSAAAYRLRPSPGLSGKQREAAS